VHKSPPGASRHVFPKLCVEREKIGVVHHNLLAVLPPVLGKCKGIFGPIGDINIVICLGLVTAQDG